MSVDELEVVNLPQKKRIVSTVIMGILLLLMLVYTIIVLPVDLNAMINSMKESNEGGGAGEAVGAVFGAFAIALIVVLLHIAFFAFIIGGGVMIIFILKNARKAYLKPIRIINWVYLGVDAFIIVTSIVKLLILFIH